MTELPDLPPPPSYSSHVPAQGAGAAARAGRARRTRFLAGAGTTTAVLALTAALALSGSSRTDSLIAHDPDPSTSPSTSSATASPTAGPSALAEPTTSGEPTVRPTAQGDPSSTPTAGPTAAPQAPGRPGAPAGPGPGSSGEDRDDYVEEPRDTAAPAQCTTPPPAEVGPVFTGGASACGYASGGGEVRQGSQARVSLGSCQSRNAGDVVFGYADGQEHEVVVTRNGSEVWRFSTTVRYPQGPHERKVRDGRCLEWTGVWPTELADGSAAPPGRYTMAVITSIARANGRAVGADEQGSATASVDVVAD